MSFSSIRDRFFYGYWVVGAGFLLMLLGIGARYSFGVFLKSIETEFSMGRGAASGIFSVYMLLCSIVAIAGGWAMDRYGPRFVGLLLGIFTGISLILTSQTTAAWQLFFTYSLLLSLGTGPVYGVANVTTSRWFVKKRGMMVGISSSGGGVGAIVLAPIATYFISAYHWRTAFLVLGLFQGLAMIGVSCLMRKDPAEMGLLPDGEKSVPSDRNGLESKDNSISEDLTMVQALKKGSFWLMFLSWVFLSLGLHMIFVHIVPHAIESGISPMDAALIISIMGLANFPGRLIVGQLSDVFGRKTLGVICPFVESLVLLWLLFGEGLWMYYIFAAIFGFMWGGGGTVITALIGDIFGTRSLGLIMGIMSGGWAAGAALGPAIGGFFYDATQGYTEAFIIGSLGLLAVCFFIGLLPKRKRN